MGPGGFTGSSGAKFVVNFSIEGSGEQDLQRIAGLFKGIQSGVNGGGGHGAGLTSEMTGLGVAALVASEGMEKLGEAGVGFVEVGAMVLEGWGHAFEAVLHKGAEFEQMLLRIQATNKTGKEAVKLAQDAIDFTTKIPITEGDAVRIMTTLATAHIDALKPLGETYAELAKKQKTLKDLPDILGLDRMAKEGPNAVTITGDLLAAMGHIGTGYQTMAIHELMQFIETGRARSPMTFGPMIVEIRNLGKTAHTAQARLKGLQELLEKRGALGISAAAMSTFGGIMSNFKGLMDKITFAVMQPGQAGGVMTQMNKGFLDLYNTVSKFFDEKTPEGEKFLHMLRDLGHFVASILTTAMRALGEALSMVFQFMADHTTLVKLAAAASVAAAAILILTGSMLVAVSAVGALLALVIAFPAALLVIPATILAVAAALGVLTGVIVVATAAYEAWVNDFGGIRTFFEDVRTIIDAATEAWKNWDGEMTHTSEETFQNLEKRGLTGFFLHTLDLMYAVRQFWDEFTGEFASRWELIGARFSAAWDKMSAAFGRIMDAVRSVLSALFMGLGEGTDTVEKATSLGGEWADKVADVLAMIADFAQDVAQYVDESIGEVPELINTFARWYGIALDTITTIKLFWHQAVGAFNETAAAISEALAVLTPFYDMMVGITKAAYHMATGDYFSAATDIAKATVESYRDAAKWAERAANFAVKGTIARGEIAADSAEYVENREKEENFRSRAQGAWDDVTRRRYEANHATPSIASTMPASLPYAEVTSQKELDDLRARAAYDQAHGTKMATQTVTHTHIYLDGKQITEVVDRTHADEKERAGFSSSGPLMSGG